MVRQKTLPEGVPPVELMNVSKTYRRTMAEPVHALRDVSLRIEPGSVVGILGPNGAGKTTLIKIILGLVEPTEGSVRIFGTPVEDHMPEIYRRVSAVLEGARNVYWRLSVVENLRYFTGIQGIDPQDVRDENRELLSFLDIEEKADEPVRNLSRGMQQKAMLACALARRTPLLFLDEPTLGLDVSATRDLRTELRRSARVDGKTIVLTSHDMDVIQEVCDTVLIVNDGRIITEDTVPALTGILQSQRYEITVAELGSTTERRLEDSFDPEIESAGGTTRVTVTIDEPEMVYDLIGLLEDGGVIIQAITSAEPDLEEVFLDLTNDDERAGRRVSERA